MAGWIRLNRKLLENDLWESEPFTKAQAWVDMIFLTNFVDGFIYVRGNKIEVKRGQLGWSELSLSKRWKWSRNKVRRFLKDLKNESQIEQQKNSVTSLITMLNYETYNPKEQQTIQQKDSRRYTNKELKKEKNNNYSVKFLEFWELLPKRKGSSKNDTFKIWKRKQIENNPDTLNQIFKTIPLYKQNTEEKYYKLSTTWLNQEMWTAEYKSNGTGHKW